MVKALYISKRYGAGSTGIHTVVSLQASDGRSGGVPHGVPTQVVHDRRFALFRRRAVRANFRESVVTPILPGQLLGERRRVRPMTD
ncbi:hypothetical protein [Parapedobacter soli]|uniref:hypothetical protein n=1 Tax=Parapedobacter soli TaxID=416955 RepID=UPI0021C8A17D|nr:hypothetical protein [Parapedobacter soli]